MKLIYKDAITKKETIIGELPTNRQMSVYEAVFLVSRKVNLKSIPEIYDTYVTASIDYNNIKMQLS